MAQVDREALRALFRTTNGSEWFNTEGWNTDADLGLWFGVQVNAEGRVVGLHLGDTYHQEGPGKQDAAGWVGYVRLTSYHKKS